MAARTKLARRSKPGKSVDVDHPLLRTKLQPPAIPGDYVHRPHLSEKLEAGRQRPVTLVSAPAGYGKSTVVACWLQSCIWPSAWVSLDENENDLRRFLAYVVFALRSLFPNSLPRSKGLVNAANLPSLSVLSGNLASELELIEQDFILVLDDLHLIENQSVHELLAELIRHPPRHMHLVAICRHDPFLPIASLRARGELAELRLQDLRFSTEETAAYLQRSFKETIDQASVAAWMGITDGWVTGLRLASLARIMSGGSANEVADWTGNAQYVMEYLFSEVLSHQPPGLRNYLLSSAILDRFCASLVAAVCEPGKGDFDATQFIAQLNARNLFIIPLDAEARWFRYHHLFQQLLRIQLERERGADEIAQLHCRASSWFENEGLIDLAIHHALVIRDFPSAAQIIGRNMNAVLKSDRWFILEGWLKKFPNEVKDRAPETLIAQMWIMYHHFRLEEISRLMERLEQLLHGKTVPRAVLGEMNHFKGMLCFWQGQGKRSLSCLDKAQKQLEKGMVARADVEVFQGFARHLVGQKDIALTTLYQQTRRDLGHGEFFLTRQLGTIGFIHLLAGELPEAARVGERIGKVARRHGLVYADLWSSCFQGYASLLTYDLAGACEHLGRIHEEKYFFHKRMAVNCMVGLAIAYQALNQPDQVTQTLRELREYAEGSEDLYNMAIFESARARLSLLQGDLASATSWLRTFHEEPHAPSMVFFLEIPAITQCRVLVAIGSPEFLPDAVIRLESLWKATKAIHNTFQMIEIGVLRALAFKKMARLDQALRVLEETLSLAAPGVWIRPFVESGAPMAELLQQLGKKNIAKDYIGRILTAFAADDRRRSRGLSESQASQAVSPSLRSYLLESLTNREVTILELLAQRLQNKEIADKLFVSTETVKTHLQNVYQKLNAKNRREAIVRAQDLGLIANG